MEEVTLSARNQIVIPREAREALGLLRIAEYSDATLLSGNPHKPQILVIPSAGFLARGICCFGDPTKSRFLASLGMTIHVGCHNILQISIEPGNKLLLVVRGDTILVLRKPKSYHRAIRDIARGIYPKGYLAKERRSWE
jgi:bifunctional DNA-binding transcriptional regulator/antitoxin component of YhaV-PrlF toxin-antitoxin module